MFHCITIIEGFGLVLLDVFTLSIPFHKCLIMTVFWNYVPSTLSVCGIPVSISSEKLLEMFLGIYKFSRSVSKHRGKLLYVSVNIQNLVVNYESWLLL